MLASNSSSKLPIWISLPQATVSMLYFISEGNSSHTHALVRRCFCWQRRCPIFKAESTALLWVPPSLSCFPGFGRTDGRQLIDWWGERWEEQSFGAQPLVVWEDSIGICYIICPWGGATAIQSTTKPLVLVQNHGFFCRNPAFLNNN